MNTDDQDIVWELSIRYDGRDADEHQIDLNQLGISLQGFARVLAVSAHYAQTGKYNKQYGALTVQVMAAPVQEHHCYEVLARIKDVALSPQLWSGFSGAVCSAVISVVLSRGRREEMKLLNEALQKSLDQNKAMQDRMMQTIDRLVDALQPSAKQAHAPIGSSVDSISLRERGNIAPSVILNRETKALVGAAPGTGIGETRRYLGVITELDMLSGACKVTLDGASPDERIPAVVTDPSVQRPNNPYVIAMARLTALQFQAKAELDEDGEIVKLHISDVVP